VYRYREFQVDDAETEKAPEEKLLMKPDALGGESGSKLIRIDSRGAQYAVFCS